MLTILAAAALLATPMDYSADIQKWRSDQEDDLKNGSAWLTLAGLYWLKPGANTIGAGEGNAVKLPEDSAPESIGNLILDGDKVTFNIQSQAEVRVDGKAATGNVLIAHDGKTNLVEINQLKFKIIVRGQRIGVRLYDLESKNLKEFSGLKWYPIKPDYKVEATLTPFDPPKMIPIKNVLGDTSMSPAAGTLHFVLNGQPCSLIAEGGDGGLFINFRDQTSGDTTYGAGRFLDADPPKDGKVILDFNKATCPPCAYTPYATCPLPPRENFLDTKVEAGELAFHHA